MPREVASALNQASRAVLRCRRCGGAGEMLSLAEGYGFLRCDCTQMPVAAGVVFGLAGPDQDQIRHAIEARQFEQARMLMLGKFAPRVRVQERLGRKLTFRRFLRHTELSQLVEILRLRKLLERMPPARVCKNLAASAQFNAYIRHRFSAPWTQGMLALLGLLEGRDGLVMDAPCGMGHLAYIISKLVPQERIVCMDLIPGFVYATRRFFVPNARLTMAFDMNNPLPLEDDAYSMIFCYDSFQHMHDKPQTTRDFMRLLQDDGILVIGHSPNRFCPHMYSDRALSPAEHAELFKDHHVRIYPDGYLAEQYLSGDPIDLGKEFSQEELDRSRDLDIVVAKDPSIFTTVPNVMERLINSARNPQLNALYRPRQRGDQVDLELHLPEALADEIRRFPQILPPNITVSQADLSGADGQFDPSRRRELIRLHVLEDLPVDY